MRGLVVFLMVAVSGVAWASEGAAPEQEITEVEAPALEEAPPAEPAAGDVDAIDEADAEAASPDAADAEGASAEADEAEAIATEPSGPAPQFRFVDLTVRLARELHRGSKVDLYAPVGPPAVVADDFGLLVERRFGR